MVIGDFPLHALGVGPRILLLRDMVKAKAKRRGQAHAVKNFGSRK